MPRRTFIADLGRGTFALAVISVAGCGPAGASGSGSPARPSSASGDPSTPPASGGGAPLAWERVNLGFVSAYILSRGGEAAIVDTGVAGSAEAIEASLTGIGLDWSAVGHVVLTHHHRDHAGSAADILGLAPGAVAYAGAEDIPSITVPRAVTAVADGDDVFGLQIVTTPGHTLGSISVLDPAGGFLVAGDALRTAAGKPTLPGADFTVDMALARQSIVKLGGRRSRRCSWATASRSRAAPRRRSRNSGRRGRAWLHGARPAARHLGGETCTHGPLWSMDGRFVARFAPGDRSGVDTPDFDLIRGPDLP